MIIDHDDALYLWCPFARAPIDETVSGNRALDNNGKVLSSCKCIGCKCMAWEFIDPNLSAIGYCKLMGTPNDRVG